MAKIADFGLARYLNIPYLNLTQNVQTLYFRAPEILLGENDYTIAIDMWSLGCIFGFIFLDKHLFTGKTEIEMIFNIF